MTPVLTDPAQVQAVLRQIAEGVLEFVPARDDPAAIAELQSAIHALFEADREGLIRIIEVRHQKQVAESPYVRVRVGQLTEAGRAWLASQS